MALADLIRNLQKQTPPAFPIQGGAWQPGSAPVPDPATGYTASDTLKQLLAALDYNYGQAEATSRQNIAGDMQRRGIRTSGIHQGALTDMAKQMSVAREAARQAAALDVYSALQRDQQMRMDWDMYQTSRQDQIAARNKESRGAMWGAAGNLLGSIWGLGKLGGGGGKSGGSGGYYNDDYRVG